MKVKRTGYGQTHYNKYASGSTTKVETVSECPYLVKITASVLNIRKQPTTGSVITGTIRDKGVYTIVEEANGTGASRWGKLKSGAGWISLDYTKRV